MVVISSVPNVLGNALFIFGVAFSFRGSANVMFILSQFVTLVGSIMIINIFRPALATWRKVNDFDQYKASLGELAADLHNGAVIEQSKPVVHSAVVQHS